MSFEIGIIIGAFIGGAVGYSMRIFEEYLQNRRKDKMCMKMAFEDINEMVNKMKVGDRVIIRGEIVSIDKESFKVTVKIDDGDETVVERYVLERDNTKNWLADE